MLLQHNWLRTRVNGLGEFSPRWANFRHFGRIFATLGEFSPLWVNFCHFGDCFIGQFFEITEFSECIFHVKSYEFTMEKFALGYILGDFFSPHHLVTLQRTCL
jgi:hypothetical protein